MQREAGRNVVHESTARRLRCAAIGGGEHIGQRANLEPLGGRISSKRIFNSTMGAK